MLDLWKNSRRESNIHTYISTQLVFFEIFNGVNTIFLTYKIFSRICLPCCSINIVRACTLWSRPNMMPMLVLHFVTCEPFNKLTFSWLWTIYNKSYIMSSISPSLFARKKYSISFSKISSDLSRSLRPTLYWPSLKWKFRYSYAYRLQCWKYILDVFGWLLNKYTLEDIILIAPLHKLKKKMDSTYNVSNFKTRTLFRI